MTTSPEPFRATRKKLSEYLRHLQCEVMTMHPRVVEVTERLVARSAAPRAAYLEHIARAARQGPHRSVLSCSNLAHGYAACGEHDKEALKGTAPNIAIVSSYNDMLSAHQPFERFPALIKEAVREAGAIAQFAGGVPAMCDGVTQGQPGMELSLFSRDVIALATAIALSHDMFDGALYLGICDKIVPGLVMAALRPSAGDLRAGRADGLGPP
jgi:phosphogluconate dehydratase